MNFLLGTLAIGVPTQTLSTLNDDNMTESDTHQVLGVPSNRKRSGISLDEFVSKKYHGNQRSPTKQDS